MKGEEVMAEPIIEITTNYKANINDWSRSLVVHHPVLSSIFNRSRLDGFREIDRLNLPRYKSQSISLTEFLKNPETRLKEMESDKFFVSLVPRKSNFRRIGKAGINKYEVIDLITEFVAPENRRYYDISLSQFFDNIFGGTIVVGKDGDLYFEFIDGNQTGVAKGNVNVKYIVWMDSITRTFKYSFSDKKTRSLAYKAILSVPHIGEGRKMQFMKGYYEVVIAQKDDKSCPKIKFIDYSNDEIYQFEFKNL